MLYPCPACGFQTFDSSIGSYDICPICNWEDDEVQHRFPKMRGGANNQSLYEWQQELLKILPAEIEETQGFYRDVNWRPLRIEDCDAKEFGLEYFQEPDEIITKYYWQK